MPEDAIGGRMVSICGAKIVSGAKFCDWRGEITPLVYIILKLKNPRLSIYGTFLYEIDNFSLKNGLYQMRRFKKITKICTVVHIVCI